MYLQVKGTIHSWKAAKGLNILPQSYPYPASPITVKSLNSKIPTADDIMVEFPEVFSDHVTTMEGEKFHISLISDAKFLKHHVLFHLLIVINLKLSLKFYSLKR